MRWRWKRLFILPLLGSVHACDCGIGSCNPDLSCGLFGGQCASEAGTCPKGLRLDPTTSCEFGASFCCEPVPTCAEMGGVCGDHCSLGNMVADCGDAGFCCILSDGNDGPSDAPSEVLDARSTDAKDATDMGVIGPCNGAPCASGCTCEAVWPDAGPVSPDAMTLPTDAGAGICVCALVDASTDAESSDDADSGEAKPLDGGSTDAETSDGVDL